MKNDKLLLGSVALCVLLVALFYAFALKGLKEPENQVYSDVVAFSSDYPTCESLIPQGSIKPGTICVHMSTRPLQTYSDVQVWSFTKHKWVNAIGIGNPNQKTVLKSGQDEYNEALPLVVKCTWGCVLGYMN